MATTPSPTVVPGVPHGADVRRATNLAGIPSVLYGPGSHRQAHATNEYAPLDEGVAVTKTIALTVLPWCSGHLEGARE